MLNLGQLRRCIPVLQIIAVSILVEKALSMFSSKTCFSTVLPEKLIVGYANWSQCDEKLLHAVDDGVNVLIWFSINLSLCPISKKPLITGGPDMNCVAEMIARMKAEGHEVVHLISIGGWNSPHPDTTHSPEDVFACWNEWNRHQIARQDIGFNGFDGFDWDIEGNDTPTSQFNHFTVECLDLMGRFSQLAKANDYIVAMAPAESYLDPSTSAFDRSLLHTHEEWSHLQPPFAYHGHNTYAYLLSRYGTTMRQEKIIDTFDFVTLQLYEGYSHATFALEVQGRSAAEYLGELTLNLTRGWWVDFAADKELHYESCRVCVDREKLVIGLANGWAGDGKFLLLPPEDVETAHRAMEELGRAPRGYAFWNILDEGRESVKAPGKPVWMTKGLRRFLSPSTN